MWADVALALVVKWLVTSGSERYRSGLDRQTVDNIARRCLTATISVIKTITK